MKMVAFADTDRSVSSLALGCLPFGTKLSKEESFGLLDYYAEAGGNFLDTANNYSFWEPNGAGGESEAILGQWFAARKNRDSVFLATKLGAYPTTSRDEFYAYGGNPWADLTEGLSRKAVLSAIDKSLARLGTDHVDLLYAHVDDRRVDQEETLDALAEVVRAGKARYIGCSNFAVWRLARARELSRAKGLPEYKAVQMFHTYLQTEKGDATGMGEQMGEDIFDYARAEGNVTLLGYTPLLWGSYTRPHKYQEIAALKSFVRPQNEVRKERLATVAKETGWSINQVIYAWMINSSPRVIPLVAVSKLEQLVEDIPAGDFTLTAEQMALLNAPLS